MHCRHAMPFGATLDRDGRAVSRLWAPSARQVELLLHVQEGAPVAVTAGDAGDGWAQVVLHHVAAGQCYQWRIDGQIVVPDPASRGNPGGPHGPSVLLDPTTFDWGDDWRGRPWTEAVFYQLHVGSFTPQGSFDAAAGQLERLAGLGITAIQLMPLGDWPGRFGWGYEGVLPYAPFHGYGDPGALKRFVQTAHRLRLMVFGDVIYNHFGPNGNYLPAYAQAFFTDRHQTVWGPGINFDGPYARTVREFFIHNALYWLEEFRFDGLRLDAVHAMHDEGPLHILDELSQRVRGAFPERFVHLVLANDNNNRSRLAAQPQPGRYDGQWGRDVHHSLHVLLTGEQDGCYSEYTDPVAQLGRSLTQGFARECGPQQSEDTSPRRAEEGAPPLTAIVNFLQNHAQIGNRPFGDRLTTLADPASLRLAQAIVLLSPSIPLLFMGEEQGTQVPFLYFAEWAGDLRDAERLGRQQGCAMAGRDAEAAESVPLPDPCRLETMARCLVPNERPQADMAELLDLRTRHLQPMLPRLAAQGHEAQHLGPMLLLHWHFDASGDQPACSLRLQANLSSQRVPAAGPPEGSVILHTVGADEAEYLGPWAGRWHWLKSP